MAITFTPGGVAAPADAVFMSTYDMIEIQRKGQVNQVYGNQRFTDLLGLFGMKKTTTSQNYEWWEQNRIQAKINATTAGGAAGAATTFTLASNDYITLTNNTPSMYNSTVTSKKVPVRKGDTIMVRPSSGTVSASTVIYGYVYSVNASANTFVAYPSDGTESFPAIATAQEIVIYSNAWGEGSMQPEGLITPVTKRTNNVQIFKEKFKQTGTASGLKTYFTYEGKNYYGYMAEQDTLKRFLNLREMGMLLSVNTVNSTLQDVLATDGTPMMTTEGLINTILDRGNTYDYSAVTGMTVADYEDLVVTLDTQKAPKNLAQFNGIELDIQIDRELRDQFKNGGINYGLFTMDEEKKVNLGFTSFKISNFTFSKKCLDTFNDLQTLGATGFNFKNEGFILPAEKMADPKTGAMIDPISMRHLESPSLNREMRVEVVDLFKTTGEDAIEVNYISEAGLETPGANRMAYLKQA